MKSLLCTQCNSIQATFPLSTFPQSKAAPKKTSTTKSIKGTSKLQNRKNLGSKRSKWKLSCSSMQTDALDASVEKEKERKEKRRKITSSSSTVPKAKKSLRTDLKKATKTPSAPATDSLDTLYHAGDLKTSKKDFLDAHIRSRRTTGHFGNGFYFTAGKKGYEILDNETDFNNRPIYTLSFQSIKNQYNLKLLKPSDLDKGERLYDLFRTLHHRLYDIVAKKTELSSIEVGHWMGWINVLNGCVYPQVNKPYKAIPLEANIIYKAFEEAIRLYKKDEYLGPIDAISTRIIKKMNFDGIDVRHLPELNNQEIGSVMYIDEVDEKFATLIRRPTEIREIVGSKVITTLLDELFPETELGMDPTKEMRTKKTT